MKKSTLKNHLLLAFLFLINIVAAKANVRVDKISIRENNTDVGYLTVVNSQVKTSFNYHVFLNRSLIPGGGSDSFEDATSTISLVINCGSCSTYPPVSADRQITNNDFKNPNTGWNVGFIDLILPAELPAGITSGSIMVKFTYYDTNQNKTLTTYLTSNLIPIRYTPPARVPVYEWVSNIGSYCLGMTIPVSSTTWNSRGIFFYAYNVQVPGTVPIFEFQGHVNDADGEPEFPANVTYYSTSTQQPIVLPGLGSGWTSAPPKVLFYAFPTQVAGTVPVYCYSNAKRNNFVFMATGEIADSYTAIQTVFYAYPVTN